MTYHITTDTGERKAAHIVKTKQSVYDQKKGAMAQWDSEAGFKKRNR